MPNDTRNCRHPMTGLYRFLGGSPLTVAFRLILPSILVGVVLAAVDSIPGISSQHPAFVSADWDLGFDATNGYALFLLGAVIVIPDLAAIADVQRPCAVVTLGGKHRCPAVPTPARGAEHPR